jgi:hypothetical protein
LEDLTNGAPTMMLTGFDPQHVDFSFAKLQLCGVSMLCINWVSEVGGVVSPDD